MTEPLDDFGLPTGRELPAPSLRDDGTGYVPELETLAARTAAIRESWSDTERAKRLRVDSQEQSWEAPSVRRAA